MSSPWLLLAGDGFTAGALGGVVAAGAAAVAVALANTTARRPWVLTGLVVLVAGLVGVARVELAEIPAVDAIVVASDQAEGRVASHPQIGPSGPRAVVEVARVHLDDGAWLETTGRVLVFFGRSVENGIAKGDIVRMRWEVTDLSAQEPGFRGFVRASGASANAWAYHTDVLERGHDRANVLVRLRDSITERLEDGIGGDAGALLAGFVTGDDSGLSGDAREAFERTNTSHITAVSGSNVAVLITLWLALVRQRRFQRSIWAFLVLAAIIWGYVVLVGFGPGAVRAGLFAVIMLPAARLGRKPDALTALMAASAIILLVRPAFASNIGFWLSLAASAAMVTVAAGWRHGDDRFWLRGMLALVAAQVATFPITFWAFDGWSPGSLVANLLLGPLVTLLFPMAFVMAALLLLMPWTGDLIGWIPKIGADVIIAIVESLAGEFPLVRPSVVGPGTLALIMLMWVAIIAGMSGDARRWLGRVVAARGVAPGRLSALLVGAAAGVWTGMVLLMVVARHY